MGNRPTVHFSNRLEELAFQLGCGLFKEGSDPFAKRLVLLPSHSMKLYLTSFFASHPQWSVCAGITFKTLLNGALDFFSEEEHCKFPSPLALSLIVEEKLREGIEEEDFFEIKQYLACKADAKYIWLAEELSRLFYEYSTSEGKILKTWKDKKGWKQSLWKRVFSSSECLSEALEKKQEEIPNQVHLFGFSHVPSPFYQFFCRLGMHLYFLSPSSCFWEDLCSDKERIFLEKKMDGKKIRLQVREQLTFLLKEAHPLLANWGKVGRALVRQLGDTESYLEEEYVDPLYEGSSALTYLQSGLFELEEMKRELSTKDTSLLCLSATSKLREVEALFETLQEFMVLHKDVEPRDILVLSSNLEAYFPYIQMVFGSQSSSIGYSVHGLSLALAEESSQAFLFFLSLAESRFDRREIIKFFSFPSVMKKFGWEAKDIKLLEEWFEKTHILWGFDPEHKKLSLDQTWPEGAFMGPLQTQGTWEEGIHRLLKGLAIDLDGTLLSEEEIPASWPLPQVEWTDAELLGRFIGAFASLKEDVKPVYQKEEKTIGEWTSLVQKWISSYFEKSSVEEALIRDLESLQQELEGKVFGLFSFTSFKRAIDTHFRRKKESFQSSHLNTVKFLSMELGASFPAKVICAIGCDEGSFPRTRIASCLEEAVVKEVPLLVDQDRYLFLEMILNARKAFVCSYERMSWKDQKEQGPSLLIQDLMNDLDKNCFFSDATLLKPSQVFTRHHPAIHFDKKYFQKEGFHNFSKGSFRLAQSYYAKEKKKIPAFFSSKENEKLAACQTIEIKKLQAFAKDPIRSHFKETLGVFFEFVSPKEEEFFLSPLTRSQIKKEAFQKGLPSQILRAKAKGQLPFGAIGEISLDVLQEDLKQLEKNLELFQVDPEEIFCLELSEDAKVMEKREGKIIMPPLSIQVEEGASISLIGEVELVCSQGFLWLGKTSKAHQIEMFPSLLIVSCLSKSLDIGAQGLLLETGKTFSLSIADPFKHLGLYVDLYRRSLKEICQIRPEWALDFLTKTRDEIEKKRVSSTSFKSFIDPYEEWMNKREALPAIDTIYELWEPQWRKVFSPLVETGGIDDNNL